MGHPFVLNRQAQCVALWNDGFVATDMRQQAGTNFRPRRLGASSREFGERQLEIVEVDRRHAGSWPRAATAIPRTWSSRLSVIIPVRTRVFTVPSGRPKRSASSDCVNP